MTISNRVIKFNFNPTIQYSVCILLLIMFLCNSNSVSSRKNWYKINTANNTLSIEIANETELTWPSKVGNVPIIRASALSHQLGDGPRGYKKIN